MIMRKTLLFSTIVLFTHFATAQTIEQQNFDSFTVGNLGTQGGYSTLNGTAADYQILSIDASHSNSLQIAGSATASGSKYAYITGGLSTNWTSRTSGNDFLNVSTEFYTGTQAGTGIGTMRSLVYDSSFNFIVGIMYDFATKTIKGLARASLNGGAATNYSFTLGTQTFAPNTWVPVSYSYDYTTGRITWNYPGGSYYLQAGTSGTSTWTMLPNVNPYEHDFISTVTTGNTISHVAAVDNLKISANAAVVLGTNTVNIEKENLSVFPNPTSDYLKFTGNVKSVQIFDLSGKNILTLKVSNNQINVKDLAKGIYIIKLQTDKQIISQKFIKK